MSLSTPSATIVLQGAALHAQPRMLVNRAVAGAVATAVAPASIDKRSARSADVTESADQAFARGRVQGAAEAAEQASEAASKEAREDGYRAGLKQGLEAAAARAADTEAAASKRHAEAAKAAEAASRERATRFDQWLATFASRLEAQTSARLAKHEDQLIAIGHAAILRLLPTRIVEREHVIAAVRAAIDDCCAVTAGGTLASLQSITVHPQDLDLLRDDASLAASLALHGAHDLRWLADPAIALGGCVVQTANGGLDATLDTQLAALRDALIGARRERPSPSKLP